MALLVDLLFSAQPRDIFLDARPKKILLRRNPQLVRPPFGDKLEAVVLTNKGGTVREEKRTALGIPSKSALLAYPAAGYFLFGRQKK